MVMTQEERWMTRYNEVKTFIETNHRNPSKHWSEEHNMLNWLKANRKKMNVEMMKELRLFMFMDLFSLLKRNKHLNQ